jgi:UDP-hydrolysing UDP-N-acetyl-D-glucosamine 2-epimerase
MVKTVAIFTSCRGDMGIFTPLIKKIYKSKSINVLLFVGGTHLLKSYGNTIDEIRKNKISITATYNYHPNKDNAFFLSKATNYSGVKLAKIFDKYDFDYVCILGDRYERLPIILNSILYKKPIIHLHGGEITEGLIDEQIRHMISKAAHLHFVICDEYKKNLLKIGESSWRVHNSGSLALDNIKKIKKLSYKKILNDFGLDKNKPFAIMTYHPVTLEFKMSQDEQIQNLFKSIKDTKIQYLITLPGSEVGSSELIKKIKIEILKNKDRMKLVDSIGFDKLYNLIPHSKFVIGNSSFGIIEVPYFKIPTINIGDRQKGRLAHKSIINTSYKTTSIKKGILKALSPKYVLSLKKMKYKFGNGNAADKIVNIISKTKINQKLLRKIL